MTRVRNSDLVALLEVIHEVAEAPDLPTFRSQVAKAVKKLIACDRAGYIELDWSARRVAVSSNEPPGKQDPALDEAFWRFYPQNPVYIHRRATGVTRALKITDFTTQREFRKTDLYNAAYRPDGVEYQLGALLESGPERRLVIGCDRRSPDFSERDRFLLDLLRPHVAQARTHVVERALLAGALAALERGTDGDRGIVLLDDAREMVAATDRAHDLLGECFGSGSNGRLPPVIAAWLANPGRWGEADRLEIERDGRCLLIEGCRVPGESTAVLFVEQRPRGDGEIAARAASLTPREREVLAWVARGKTNSQIGRTLVVSPRTVQKHLEHIFRKLGVQNRTEAAAAVFEQQRPGQG